MKKNMVICGNYGAGNIGDEAILRALIQKFESSYKVTVMSANPEETTNQFKVDAVGRFPGGIRSKIGSLLLPKRRKALNSTKWAVQNCDVFVLGGGTLLTDTPLSSILIWSKQVEPAFLLGKEVWIYANGIGPLEHDFSRKIGTSILRRATKVSVRDLRSIEWTQKLGCEKAEKIDDPVFDLTVESGKEVSGINENTVIFVPRFWSKNLDKLESSFSKFIHYLCEEEGLSVVGIPFEKDNSKDCQFLNKIFEQARVGEKAKLWKNYTDDLNVIQAISQAKLVVGMRLHSLIFAEITQTPFVGISYMEKVSGLGENLKKTDCIVAVEEISFEKLKVAYKASLKADL